MEVPFLESILAFLKTSYFLLTFLGCALGAAMYFAIAAFLYKKELREVRDFAQSKGKGDLDSVHFSYSIVRGVKWEAKFFPSEEKKSLAKQVEVQEDENQ